MEEVFACVRLTKRYGSKTVLDDITLSVEPGEVCAVLGRNGAGKTTMLRVALGLAFPTSGVVRVLGAPPGTRNDEVAFLSENVAIYPHLSARDNLRVAAAACGMRPLSTGNIENILDSVTLMEAAHKRASSFSLGMKRRLQLAMATMLRPHKLLILDEPTNGLDVEGLLWFKRFLLRERETGVSIVVASHALLDLQDIISTYAILNKGSIARRDTWHPTGDKGAIEVVIEPGDMSATVEAIFQAGGWVVTQSEGRLRAGGLRDLRAAHHALFAAGVVPLEVKAAGQTLEDVFLAVTGEPVTP